MKIAFLLDNLKISHYSYNLIKISKNYFGDDNIILIFDDINNNKKNIKNIKVSKLKKNIFKSILYRITFFFEKKKLSKIYPKNQYGKIFLASELDLKKIFIDCAYSKSGLYKSFDNNIDTIQKLNLDAIIRCNSGILKGKILDVAKYGILSSHHGDSRYYKGGPSGFWEVYEKSKKSGYIIQKLTSSLDDGDIIYREELDTKKTWLLNRFNLQKNSLESWKNIFQLISKNKKMEYIEKDKTKEKIYNNVKINKFPKNSKLLIYFLKSFCLLHYL